MISVPIAQSGRETIALATLHAGYSHSSLALQSIRAYAVNEPFYAQIQIYESLVNTNHQSLLEQLVSSQPVIIGFSTYLWNIHATVRLTKILKQLLPGCYVLFGGPEAGPRGKALLQTMPMLDFVVDGEGEAAFRDLVRVLLYGEGDLGDISGLIYRQSGKIYVNPVRLLPVEQIPSPVLSEIHSFEKSLVYWETSRGCPFRCSFCSSATERLRAFPIERVESELKVLERLENKTVKLLDRSFHLGKERTQRLLQRFADTPPGLRFHLELNPDRVSEEAMAIFQRAIPGKFQFEIGLQTLHEPVLDAIDRQMDIPKALGNIRQLVQMHRHPVHLDLIVGLPGEDAAHCATSLDKVFQLYPDHLQLGTLKLLPGTPLLAQAEPLGYRWDREPPYEVLSHPLLNFQEIARFKLYAELLERLWNSGYLRTILAGLVLHNFEGRLSACFEDMLNELGDGLARDNLQPDSLFSSLSGFVLSRLDQNPTLGEWLLWDYSHFSLVNRKTPEWISHQLLGCEKLTVNGTRRRLPVMNLSDGAVDLINRFSMKPLQAGRYAVWPRQHKKGIPVEIIPLD
ncbi:MAG: B12-binding domain-containing radical SAM protein [Candidatus Thiodiazotropha sp. (ex Semelilucina semeliformis)]|nr:B12-binding domain-containing radical SAM protein [Candidatus Thiodiazotropha sp. (ex Semelilucina semeliformis)]